MLMSVRGGWVSAGVRGGTNVAVECGGVLGGDAWCAGALGESEFWGGGAIGRRWWNRSCRRCGAGVVGVASEAATSRKMATTGIFKIDIV